MDKKAGLTPSLEDYLEVIYHIIQEKQAARVKEISKRLKVNNSSVTGALKSLKKKGFLNYSPYDVITLTQSGEKTALDVIRRHEVLKKFFTHILCIDEETADDAACKMEHAVTPEVLEKIVRFVEFCEICPISGSEWIEGFKRFCGTGTPAEQCPQWNECRMSLKNKDDVCPVFESETMPLTRLEKGKRARLVCFESDDGVVSKLKSLGIVPGSLFTVEDINPETQDMDVFVRGYRFTLRKESAGQITVAAC